MNRGKQDRDVKTILGMPMRWNAKAVFRNFWNKNDDRLFPPKQFGIGWDLNLHALLRKLGILAKPKK